MITDRIAIRTNKEKYTFQFSKKLLSKTMLVDVLQIYIY